MQQYLPTLLISAALTSGAFLLHGEIQTLYLAASMLILPFFDKKWRWYSMMQLQHWPYYLVLITVSLGLIYTTGSSLQLVLHFLLVSSIAEEFFFRVYLLDRLGMSDRANVLSSLLFTVVHISALQSAEGLLVLLPSLVFGYVYIKKKDFALNVLLHFIANVFYTAALK